LISRFSSRLFKRPVTPVRTHSRFLSTRRGQGESAAPAIRRVDPLSTPRPPSRRARAPPWPRGPPPRPRLLGWSGPRKRYSRGRVGPHVVKYGIFVPYKIRNARRNCATYRHVALIRAPPCPPRVGFVRLGGGTPPRTGAPADPSPLPPVRNTVKMDRRSVGPIGRRQRGARAPFPHVPGPDFFRRPA